jgi:thiamine-monophosphate kinase
MKSLDETEIIKIFQRSFGKKGHFQADDIEVLRIGNNKIVTKSDMLVQSTDVLPGMKLEEIARKSIVSCVSDLACKGVRPRFATIALAVPHGFTKKQVNNLARGFLESSKEFGFHIIGGDTNEGKEIVIEISMFGAANKKMPSRSGAKSGDIIIASGPFGYTSAGLKIALEGYKSDHSSIKKFKDATFRAKPRLDFGLRAAEYFSSSMDSSDGLSITLDDMSRQSRKKFTVTNLPIDNHVIKFALKNKTSLERLVFCGGEEYEIVSTVHPRNLPRVREIARRTDTPLYEIGHVKDGRGVVFANNGKTKVIKRCGWTHLRS